jgi:two-component system, NtrC family, response regulator PilR
MKAKILIVDDEAQLREMLRLLFEADGCSVAEAGDGAALRQQLEGPAPDLLLLDLNLPDGNGVNLLPEIKKHWPDCKTVIITGYGSVEAAEGAFKVDHELFLQSKPFDTEILKAVVETALDTSDSCAAEAHA